jgi:hypothetical protein
MQPFDTTASTATPTLNPGLRQHYRPARFSAPGWLRQLWLWF